jgi:hypothetical protein
VAGLSSLLAFTLVVGRAEHRFVLPLGAWLSVYAGALFAALGRPGRWIGGALVAHAAAGPLALWVTQHVDARRAVSAYLAIQPQGTMIEVYGKVVYLPHLDVSPDAPYRVRRVGRTAPERRDPIIGAEELRAARTASAARARGADVLVVPEGWASRFRPRATGKGEIRSKIATRARRAGEAQAFFRGALEGTLPGYRHALVAEPAWPAWLSAVGLEPIEIHGSTGRRVWVLERAGRTRPR